MASVEFLVTAVSLLLALGVEVGATARDALAGPPELDRADDLVAKATDTRTPEVQRFEALQRLTEQPEPIANAGLRRLALSDDRRIAAAAAAYCVDNGRIGAVADELVRVISKWPYEEQGTVFDSLLRQRAAVRKSAVAVRLAKAVLEDSAANTEAEIVPGADSLGSSARILADAGDPDARRLIERAISTHPKAWTLWMALAQVGGVRPEQEALARSVYRDEGAPKVLRVAVALALGKRDAAAAKFGLAEIDAFGKKYANFSEASALAAESGGEKALMEQTDLLRKDLPLIGLLQFAELGEDDAMLAALLRSRNEDCQGLGALVIALRWPRLLLDADSAAAMGERYKPLLAVAVLWHPELRAEVTEKIGQAALEAATKRVCSRRGLDAFLGIGFGIPTMMLPGL
jgi:hypothetical protein